jgi:hypothetical protein
MINNDQIDPSGESDYLVFHFNSTKIAERSEAKSTVCTKRSLSSKIESMIL